MILKVSHKPKDNLCVAERKDLQVLLTDKGNITAALNIIKKSEGCIPSGRLNVQDDGLGLHLVYEMKNHPSPRKVVTF
jgi:hypothetical protein